LSNPAPHINWTKRALDFLTGLSAAKEIKGEYAAIIKMVQNLLMETTGADAICFYRNIDQVTMRNMVSWPQHTFHSHFDQYALAPYTNATRYSWLEQDTQQFLFQAARFDQSVIIPFQNSSFSGGLILGWTDTPEDTGSFTSFVEAVELGMKELMRLMSAYYDIEELSLRFNGILETIPEGIVYVDDSGKTAWVNNMGGQLLELKAGPNEPFEVATAMQKLRNLATNQAEIQEKALALFSSPNQTIKDWIWMFGKPLNKVLSVTCKPIVSNNVRGRLWVYSDITFSHLATAQLKELNEE